MLTYTKLSGEVLDLSGLSAGEAAYFDHVYQMYRTGMPWAEFGNNYVYGSENLLLTPTGGIVNREVYVHPLFQAPHPALQLPYLLKVVGNKRVLAHPSGLFLK